MLDTTSAPLAASATAAAATRVDPRESAADAVSTMLRAKTPAAATASVAAAAPATSSLYVVPLAPAGSRSSHAAHPAELDERAKVAVMLPVAPADTLSRVNPARFAQLFSASWRSVKLPGAV